MTINEDDKTRVPSDPKPTSRECLHLFMRGHFRSRDSWRSHYSICCSQKSHATCELHGSIFYKTGVTADRSYTLENRDFRPFVLLWPWPWPDDLHIWTWPVFRRDIPDVRKWTSTSRLSKVIILQTYRRTDRQTRPKLYTTPLRGWSTKVRLTGSVIK